MTSMASHRSARHALTATLVAVVALALPALAHAADTDADGLPDEVDTCPALSAATASGCPAVASTVSLKYSPRRKRFDGHVSSTPACVWSRVVTVFRREQGPDVPVFVAGTDISGNFQVRQRGRKGRHYALVAESVVPGSAACGAAVSPSFKIK
jgi:hypothetical protein